MTTSIPNPTERVRQTSGSPASMNDNLDDQTLRRTYYYDMKKQVRRKEVMLRLAVLLIILNLILIVNAFSQVVTVRNIGITNTAQITVKGDILFSTGATMNNNGELAVSGNFTNNSGGSLFGASEGTVVLNGNNQDIAGSHVTHFNNLELQNGGTKTLLQDALTGGNNLMNTGVLSIGASSLDLNSHTLTVSNAQPGAITRTSGFIVSETDPLAGYGIISRLVKNNTGLYEFPFGNAQTGHYIPVNFEITTPGVGNNGIISLSTYPTATAATPNNRPLPAGLGSLLSVAGSENAHNTLDRWWVVDVNGYTDKPVSSVTFTYRDSEWDLSGGSTNTIVENMLQAQSNDGLVWDPFTMGTVNTTANTVTVNSINNYKPFWTLVGSNNPLPIELLVFDARAGKNRQSDLNWITAAEKDNDFFTIERSRDGINFSAIGRVEGAGNSTNNVYYTFVDKNPFDGVNYYRLKQTDFNGSYSYSETRTVTFDKPVVDAFKVYPNPAMEQFYIQIEGEVSSDRIYISDKTGKVVREISIDTMSAQDVVNIPVQRNGMAPGVYVITLPGKQPVRLVLQ
jgi:hypothetical protein